MCYDIGLRTVLPGPLPLISNHSTNASRPLVKIQEREIFSGTASTGTGSAVDDMVQSVKNRGEVASDEFSLLKTKLQALLDKNWLFYRMP